MTRSPSRRSHRRERRRYNLESLYVAFSQRSFDTHNHRDLSVAFTEFLRETLDASYGMIFRIATYGAPRTEAAPEWLLLGGSGPMPDLGPEERTRSLDFPGSLCLPFTLRGVTIGMIVLGPKTTHLGYTKRDQGIVLSLAQFVGMRMYLFDYISMEREKSRQVEVLQEAMKMQEQFLNMVSHELRTPVSIIFAAISFLKHEVDTSQNSLLETYHGRIYRNAESLILLVSDLLNAGQLQSGTFALDMQACSLSRLILEAIEDLMPLVEEKGQRLTYRTSGLPESITGDSQRLGQVIRNLVINASRHNPVGTTVEVSAMRKPDAVRCEVRDDGIGISAENRSKLFQRFSRLELHDHAEQHGVGLGLFIARAIVEAHGGTIGVESAPGRGSTFWFELPVETRPKWSSAQPGDHEELSTAAETR